MCQWVNVLLYPLLFALGTSVFRKSHYRGRSWLLLGLGPRPHSAQVVHAVLNAGLMGLGMVSLGHTRGAASWGKASNCVFI